MGQTSGGKVNCSHSTAVEGVQRLVTFLEPLDCVSKIVLGVITSRAGSTKSSTWTVKIVDESHCTLVRCTKGGTVQEFRFYCVNGNSHKAKFALAKFVRDSGWGLSFKKSE